MKQIIIVFFILAFAQRVEAQNSPAQQVAEKVAGKMMDSLQLNAMQKTQVYNINIQLHQRKMAMRQQYSSADSLTLKIQEVENTRDSLYSSVLTQQQFNLYRQKKKWLVSNN